MTFNRGISASYYIRETANYDATGHYGDGTSDRFRLTLSPDSSALAPIRLVEVGFACQTSQGVPLERSGDNSAGLEGGTLLWEDETKFDEIKYVLTTKDKTKAYLTAEKGVYKIEDSLGNVVTVDEDGYHGEGNKGIDLTRNEEELITSATDGNTTSYTYDDSGNITTVTDAEGNTTTSRYNTRGRITSQTDGEGNRTAYEYDSNNNLTRVTDAHNRKTESLSFLYVFI